MKRTLLVHTPLFVLISSIALFVNADLILVGLDGGWFQILIRDQAVWSNFFSQTSNPLQGIGDQFVPWNTNLNITIQIAKLFSQDPISRSFQVALMTVVSVEIFFSVILVGGLTKSSKFVTINSAWLLGLTATPAIAVIKQNFITEPILSEFLLILSLFLCFLEKIGKTKLLLRNILLTICAIILIQYLCCSGPLKVILIFPLLGIFSIALIMRCETREIFKARIYALTAIVLSLVLLNNPEFLAGLYLYSAAYFFQDEFWRHQTELTHVSSFFYFAKPFSAVLISLSFVGALISLRQEKNNLIHLAFIFSVFFIFFAGFILISLPFYQGPSSSYFERLIFPFYVIYFLRFIEYLMLWGEENFKKIKLKSGKNFYLQIYFRNFLFFLEKKKLLKELPVMAILLFLFMLRDPENNEWHLENFEKNEITQILEEKIRASPGSPFNGTVASFLGLLGSEKYGTWNKQVGYDYETFMEFGSDFRSIGLWKYNIPTLFQYSQTISPELYYVVSRFLGRGEDLQERNKLLFTKIDKNILKVLGVRFLITEKKYPKANFITSVFHPKSGKEIFLYEFDNPNLGNYSPKNKIFAKNLEEFQSIAKKIDFQKTVIIHEDISSEIIPVTFAKVSYKKGGIKVLVKSASTSLLVLPFQYSNCLSLEKLNYLDGFAVIKRVNLVETGLLFKGEVEAVIDFETGIFKRHDCRMKDFFDFKKILNQM